MRLTFSIILGVIAMVPAYVLARVLVLYVWGFAGSGPLSEVIASLASGAGASLALIHVIGYFADEHFDPKTPIVATGTVVATILVLLSVIGIVNGYEYRGSHLIVVLSSIAVPLGFISVLVVSHRD